MIDETEFSVDPELLQESAKPLFYGFTFLAGLTLTTAPAYAGTLLGTGLLAAVSFVSAGLTDGLEEDWGRLMEIVAVVSLLGAVMAASYLAMVLSMV
ncbi:MAG: hypothetical protein ABEJ98_02625 [Candidatus Nanohaloarchaea archaeon]